MRACLTAVYRAPTVGTQSALLAGFAYNGIIQVDIPEDANELLRGAWLVTSCFAMGFEMICLVSTSFCVMFGPGLALRGARRGAAPAPAPSPSAFTRAPLAEPRPHAWQDRMVACTRQWTVSCSSTGALPYSTAQGAAPPRPVPGPHGRGMATEAWLTAAWRGGGRMSMFFLSLMLFAWLCFDWHAALPMMIAMFWACYGAPPPPSRADSAPVTQCPHPTARATLAKALR